MRLRRAPCHGQRGHLLLERARVTARQQLQVGHGALEVEVRVVLPGEADAAERLDALLGAVRGRFERHGAGDARAEIARRLRLRLGVLAPDRRGVPRHRGALLHGHQHVGQRVLDRLELPDGPAELDAHLGVVRRRAQAPAGDAGALGRRQHQGQVTHLHVGHRDELIDGQHERVAGDLELPEGAGAVEGRQRRHRHRVAQLLAVEQPPRRAVLPLVERDEHQAGRREAEHRAEGAAEATSHHHLPSPPRTVAGRSGSAPSATAAVTVPSARPGR